MRNKLLSAMTLLAITVSPAVTIAEPETQAKEIDETKIVETIKSVVDTHLDSKEEVATRQIEENLKKIEEERKAAEVAAAEAAKKAAEAKAAAKAAKPVVVKPAAPVDLQALYQAAGAKFGVNPAILAAVHMVETGQSGDTTRASGAGAQGPMQFLASTFRSYAVDGDGDGVANIYDVHDAVFSAAKYLAANGAAAGNVTNALLRYNHSMTYVNHVLAIARGYGYTG